MGGRHLLRRMPVLVAGILSFGVFGIALWIWRFGRKDRAAPAEVIVVLGAQVRPDGAPSPALLARVEKGVALYRQGIAPLLLMSGGGGADRPAEARVMATLARDLGVPFESLLLETESRSTFENARFSTAMLTRQGPVRAVVVSDAFHLLRARQQFRCAGLEVQTSPAAQTHLSMEGRLYWTLREAFALLARPSVLFARRTDRAPEQPRR